MATIYDSNKRFERGMKMKKLEKTFRVFSTVTDETVAMCKTRMETMRAILTHDGYAYKFIRRPDGMLTLWTSDGSANSTRGARQFVETIVKSNRPGKEAQLEIADYVIAACEDFARGLDVEMVKGYAP